MIKKKYKSKVLKAVHESASGLHRIGLISAKTMREFDDSCLTTVVDLTPKQIAQVRIHTGVSQAVFAKHLNVSVASVSKWERGEKKPHGKSMTTIEEIKR